MEERFLLNGIALHSTDIAPGNIQLASLVEADLAHARLTFRNRATVAARVAANAIALNRLVQVARADVLIQDLAKGGHREYL
jgi:hypothetical protein